MNGVATQLERFSAKNDPFKNRLMKQVALKVKTRDALGRGPVNRLRAEGQIPAVVYGESGVRHLQVDAHEFSLAWRRIGNRASLLELHTEGTEETTFAIIKEFQRDAQSDQFLHIDLLEVVRGKEMEADIPVHTTGTPYGVKNEQGVLEVVTYELTVRCRPRDLPESIVVPVADLKVGDIVRVEDLAAIEGITFINDPELVVVACVGSSGGRSGDEAEEAEEVEEEETASA